MINLLIGENFMMKLPLTFEVVSEAQSGISTLWKTQADANIQIDCSIPPEFSGPGGGYSSEDFFGMAIINCIIGTFKFLCEKKKQTFNKIKGKARLTIDSDRVHLLKFTSVDLVFTVEGASSRELVKKNLEEAISNCPVCNSIHLPKTLHITVN